MRLDRFNRAEMALLWIGRYLVRYFIPLIGLVALAAYNFVPALDCPPLHVGGPVVLAGLVLWPALRAASRDSIMWLARVYLLVVILVGGGTTILLMASWHLERLCQDQPQDRTCTEVAPPIIRFFNGWRPEFRPDIPPNP
ncbi:MAG TPA: hypothetical protein VLA50_01045 [Erythrobacter sp.]|nr:hypothetical protein [Erythrobacter sp.]